MFMRLEYKMGLNMKFIPDMWKSLNIIDSCQVQMPRQIRLLFGYNIFYSLCVVLIDLAQFLTLNPYQHHLNI